MNHNNTPDMGMSIYMNGCSCGHLWDEVRSQERQTNDSHDHRQGYDFDNWPLAMAYVPMQPWEEPYDLGKGLRAGTIFPCLHLPFMGGGHK